MAIEHGHLAIERVSFPIKNGDFAYTVVYVTCLPKGSSKRMKLIISSTEMLQLPCPGTTHPSWTEDTYNKPFAINLAASNPPVANHVPAGWWLTKPL